jgi:NAD(P)-dependent dehydrogenase (short-subunit alcohol dehydrogenase family)
MPAAKAGVIGMTKAVGKECAKYDIAINAISLNRTGNSGGCLV